jgi:predicted Zn-ribbon and HTH transcriptional regulator
MPTLDRTPRQRIMDLLTIAPRSAEQLAAVIKIPERQVEEHLRHIMKSVAHDPLRRFVLQPSACADCDFVFRDRSRLTRPSRCPRCRGEAISAPRYSIQRDTVEEK